MGGVAGVALLAGALVWLLRRRGSSNATNLPPYDEKSAALPGRSETDPIVRSELPAVDRPYEADGVQRSELDGGARRYWK